MQANTYCAGCTQRLECGYTGPASGWRCKDCLFKLVSDGNATLSQEGRCSSCGDETSEQAVCSSCRMCNYCGDNEQYVCESCAENKCDDCDSDERVLCNDCARENWGVGDLECDECGSSPETLLCFEHSRIKCDQGCDEEADVIRCNDHAGNVTTITNPGANTSSGTSTTLTIDIDTDGSMTTSDGLSINWG